MSLERLEEHRRVWRTKAVLAGIYGVWFDALLEGLGPTDRVLEVGAGPGFLSEYARRRNPRLRWVATDILRAPWNDLVADAARLPFRSESMDAVVALDLVHHLGRPAGFFGEAARVLRPGGRICVVEPWVTPLSFPVYRFLHEEACHLDLDPWDPFGVAGGASKDAFDGDAGVMRRIAKDTPVERWRGFGLSPPKLRPLNGFAYLLSMGFQPGSLLPRPLLPFFQGLDRLTSALAPVLGMRVVAEWRRALSEPPASA